MRDAVSITLDRMSVRLRRCAGSVYPQGHPLRVWNHEVANSLEGAARAYVESRAVREANRAATVFMWLIICIAATMTLADASIKGDNVGPHLDFIADLRSIYL